MKLFGFLKPKAEPFPKFRDYVRQVVRHNEPSAKFENNDNGFILTIKKTPIACNLKNLYATYSRDPRERDSVVKQWIDTLIMEVPEQTWSEAMASLRPTLKTNEYVKLANIQMKKANNADALSARPFIGDLAVIIVREYGGTLTAVSDLQLQQWGVTLDDAIRQALNNMSVMGFPAPITEMRSQGSLTRGGAGAGDVVGLVFEHDHLTATWLLLERFRDHIGMKLHHDFVVAVPYRSRLVAVRADEPGLVASVLQSARSARNISYGLTSQCYHVDMTSTGGKVTIFTGKHKGEGIGDGDMFGTGSMGGTLQSITNAAALNAPALGSAGAKSAPMVDFSQWGLSEPTDGQGDEVATPW